MFLDMYSHSGYNFFLTRPTGVSSPRYGWFDCSNGRAFHEGFLKYKVWMGEKCLQVLTFQCIYRVSEPRGTTAFEKTWSQWT